MVLLKRSAGLWEFRGTGTVSPAASCWALRRLLGRAQLSQPQEKGPRAPGLAAGRASPLPGCSSQPLAGAGWRGRGGGGVCVLYCSAALVSSITSNEPFEYCQSTPRLGNGTQAATQVRVPGRVRQITSPVALVILAALLVSRRCSSERERVGNDRRR